MRRVQHSSHKGKSSRSPVLSGGTAEGISIAEFIDRLNEHSSVHTSAKRSFKDLIATIVSIPSLRLFKNIIG